MIIGLIRWYWAVRGVRKFTKVYWVKKYWFIHYTIFQKFIFIFIFSYDKCFDVFFFTLLFDFQFRKNAAMVFDFILLCVFPATIAFLYTNHRLIIFFAMNTVYTILCMQIQGFVVWIKMKMFSYFFYLVKNLFLIYLKTKIKS